MACPTTVQEEFKEYTIKLRELESRMSHLRNAQENTMVQMSLREIRDTCVALENFSAARAIFSDIHYMAERAITLIDRATVYCNYQAQF